MDDALTSFSTRTTPQSQRADAAQTRNRAGGYTFTVDDTQRLRRFLTLGVEGGTFYVKAGELAVENAQVVMRMAKNDHATLLSTILDVSTRGAAPKANPALFALAIAASHGNDVERANALALLPQIARTGTHLLIFARYIEQFRGWGRGLRRGVANWYTSKSADDLAYQAVKYRQREGWSQRDVLRLAHPVTADPALRSTFEWMTSGSTNEHTPRLIEGFIRANEAGADVPALVREFGLSWEMLPDAALGQTATWDALLDVGVPQTALMRQLPRLTRLGMLSNTGSRTAEIAARLADAERLRRARVHPINALVAQRTYASGYSARGESTWTPSRVIIDALDAAFYASFGAVAPANKRTMLALDISGSMSWYPIANMVITPREASAALALVQMSTEPACEVMGFSSGSRMTELAISPRQRLDDAIRTVSGLPAGGTDAALPVNHALAARQEIDTFVVYTDNETWAGYSHPHQALRTYRERMGIDARMIVVGMTASNASIADPNDPGMLDVAGFDSGTPSLISEFSRGL